MCGIAGVASLDGPCSRSVVEAMCSLLVHRGPDSGGVVEHRLGRLAAALGARRLSIRDLSPIGNQPMSTTDGLVSLVYNGEIYNHQELRRELLARGQTFRSHGDTETVLHAYHEWGLDALARLQGMFALALFDRRAGRLVLARDGMGIKPLYFRWDGRMLRFASELKVLLADAGIPRRVDPDGLELYLTFGYVPSPYTLIDGVKKLEPGRALVLDEAGLTWHDFRRWQPSAAPGDETPSATARCDDDTTRLRVQRAVRRQLVSDVPVGVLLSGGLDSSIVATLAAEHARPLHTFSAAYRVDGNPSAPLRSYNEDSAHARRLAERLGTVHHEVVLDASSDAEGTLRHLAAQLDEPLFEPVYVVLHLLCAEAQRQGVRVLLTGDGADELFHGYSARYQMPARAQKYRRLPLARQLADLAARLAPAPAVRSQAAGVRRILRARTPAQAYLAYTEVFEGPERARLLGRDPVAGTDGELAEAVVERAMGLASALGLTHALACTDLLLWVGEHFNPRLDRISMMHSVEARVPFQDDELVDHFMWIDPRVNLAGGAGKGLLRRAFADRLPGDVLQRPKRSFQAPGATLTRHGLQRLVPELLGAGHVRQFGLLDPMATQAVTRRALDAGQPRNFELWTLLALQLWCDAFLGAGTRAHAA
jgi:asparagine synthase (glutamine-hydrolysing)